MHRLWKCLVATVFVGSSLAHASDKAVLTQRLHNTAENSSLDDPGLKPWHLKLSVQFFDAKGNPSEQATIEEWRDGARDKRIYASPSYSSTEITRDKGIFRSVGKPAPPYIFYSIRDQVVHPLEELAVNKDVVPELRTETLGNVKLDCIMLDPANNAITSPPLGLFPTYCLDQTVDRLRISYNLGSENVTRNTLGTFQGRSVAIDITVALNNAMVAKAHVETLSGLTPTEHLFDADSSLEVQSADAVQVSTKDMAAFVINKVFPVYPEDAKRGHVSGTVDMRARIGADGHVERLELIDAPISSLAVSALAAARQWTYKPYLLNGIPSPVDTTIVIHYNFGGG